MDIPRIMHALVKELQQRGDLELVEGATPEAVAVELLDALEDHDGPGHLGSFVASVLISSKLVDELYVEDRDIVRLVTEVGSSV